MGVPCPAFEMAAYKAALVRSRLVVLVQHDVSASQISCEGGTVFWE